MGLRDLGLGIELERENLWGYLDVLWSKEGLGIGTKPCQIMSPHDLGFRFGGKVLEVRFYSVASYDLQNKKGS